MRPRTMAATLFAICIAATSAMAQPFEIRTVVAQFNGESELGRSVATILSLQLWQTLRKHPTPNPKRLDFGDGKVLWLGQEAIARTHIGASRASRQAMAQAILWGNVRIFDADALVTAYLTIPKGFDFRTKKHEIWEVLLNRNNARRTLKVDIPQRAYTFEPIILPQEFVTKYRTPDSLAILSSPSKIGGRIGTIGQTYRRIANSGEYARVQSGGVSGWVYLPQLGLNRPEIVDFVAGIIRIFRGDWNGARESFEKVVANASIPASVRADSLLYIIRARSELQQVAEAEIEAVLKLAPASRRAVQYAVMHRLIACNTKDLQQADCTKRERASVELLTRTHALFPPEDPWLKTVASILPLRR